MKIQPTSEDSEKGTYDPNLDKLESKDLFPEKTAIARAILAKAKLPQHPSKPANSFKI